MQKLALFAFARFGDTPRQGLVPLFRTSPFSNLCYMQNVKPDGRIGEFLPVSASDALLPYHGDIQVDVGDRSIIAFSLSESKIICGTEKSLSQDHSREIIELYEMEMPSRDAPFLANLAISLFDVIPQQIRSRALKRAFHEFSGRSNRVAAAWRDGIAIPNLVRAVGAQSDLGPFYVSSQPPKCTIFSKSLFPEEIAKALIPEIQAFGIRAIDNRIWQPLGSQFSDVRWLLLGQGGVARYVIENEPFSGGPILMSGSSSPFSVASINALAFEASTATSTVAVTKSDVRSVRQTISVLNELQLSRGRTHIFNIRPIGYGNVSDRMLSPFEVAKETRRRGHTWAVSRHRLRQSPSGHNGLRASNMASRIVKLAAMSLIEAEASTNEFMQDTVELLRQSEGLGVASSVKLLDPSDIEENVARLFRSCASTEFDIEAGSDFIVFWPGDVSYDNEFTFRTLGDWRTARIAPLYQSNFNSLVGFRTNVRGSDASSFRRLCAMVMEDYRWRYRGEDEFRLFFENEGEAEIVMPVFGRRQFERCIQHHREDRMQEILVTDFALRDTDYDRLREDEVVMHFSEVGTWMRQRFGVRQYEEW